MNWFGKTFSSLFLSLGIGLCIYTFCLFSLPKTHVLAAEPWRFSGFGKEFDAADSGEVNAGAYVDRTFTATLVSPACQISPIIYFCSDSPIKISQLQKRSVIGMTSNIIAATFTDPPARTYAFIQDMGQTLGFIPKQAYAQGAGFSGLSPLLPLWKAFRDVAYSLLALVMIVIGFMVMLRKKIDPKTVVTVQNALPRIVITLLLITFSYAIVGIVVDLMYVVILIVLSLFESTHLLTGPDWFQKLTTWNTTSQQLYTTGSLLDNLNHIRITPWQILGFPVPDDQNGLKQFFVNMFGGNFVTGWVVGIVLGAIDPANANLGEALGQSAGGFIAGFGMSLFYFLMSLAMLFLFIRLTVLFVGAYIQIVISLLFGPLQILFEAIPGSTAFSSWLKNLVANVSVFAVGATMFMLANVFATFANNPGQKLWTPPYMGLMSNVTSLGALIGLGILFSIPSIAGQIKEALKAKSVMGAGGGGQGLVGFGATAAQYGFQYWMGKRNLEAQTRSMQGWMSSSKNLPAGGGGGGGKPEKEH
jgi:hypothetical protein